MCQNECVKCHVSSAFCLMRLHVILCACVHVRECVYVCVTSRQAIGFPSHEDARLLESTHFSREALQQPTIDAMRTKSEVL